MPEDGVALALISILFRPDLSLRWRAPMTGPGAGADSLLGIFYGEGHLGEK